MDKNNPVEKFTNFFTELLEDKNPLEHIGKNIIPSMNLYETENKYVIEVCAPGISKEELKVKISASAIIISYFTKKIEDDSEKKFYSKREFIYKDFEKKSSIPENILKEQIMANFENGILTITLPKDLTKEEKEEEIEIL